MTAHRMNSLRLALMLALFVAALPAIGTAQPIAAPGLCGDPTADGKITVTDALITLNKAVGLEVPCSPLSCDVSGGVDGATVGDALSILRVATSVIDADSLSCPTAVRFWNERLLDAIRLDTPRPTVHARNLFHLSVTAWDCWVAYDTGINAAPYLVEETGAESGSVEAARSKCISYAAYRLLKHRFTVSPGAVQSQAAFDSAMDELGCDSTVTTTDGDSPEAIGNRIGEAVIAYGAIDGANEAADYADDTGYAPVNEALIVSIAGNPMNDPNRWQPLSLDFFVTQNGIPLPIDEQEFISPNWDNVTPFALVRPAPGVPYVDPGLPPQLGGEGDPEFRDAVLEVLRLSSQVDPDDGVMIDISPASNGNNPLGTDSGSGRPVNPATGEPYATNLVKRADYGRVLAEFWADGPDSETPPGHWNTIAHTVTDDPRFERRIEGMGEELDPLEWDAKLHLALNGALHDGAIAAWGSKAIYDYSRPISMIRYMATLGQSSDPAGDSYHPDGLPLEAGLVELITAASTAPGERHAHLAGREGEVAVFAWQGNPEDPETQYTGAGWIRAQLWVPYQRETFVSPAFAAYPSGHSVFSQCGAAVLMRITGSEYFPGGYGEFLAPAGDFLEFEFGPEEDIRLQWATYRDAADEAGLSRRYGGIHVRADDWDGRVMGATVGETAYDLARQYWDGSRAR